MFYGITMNTETGNVAKNEVTVTAAELLEAIEKQTPLYKNGPGVIGVLFSLHEGNFAN